ncbi:MAG TPA: DUF2171 domain-containing protein [Allosphingosinicella sp.]|jgi:hypothetical protein
MGNDDRYGGGREGGRGFDGGRGRDWRDEDRGRGWNEGRREESGWGPAPGGDRGRGGGGGGHDDRGFFERATETARSWFGGDDDHGHGGGRGGYERERGGGGSHRDNGFNEGGPGNLGGGGFGGGWGNQQAESWNQDRPGRPGWFTDSVGGERGNRPGAGGGSDHHYGARGQHRPEQGGGFRDQHGGPGGSGFAQSHGGGGSQSYSPMTGDYGRGSQVHDPHYSEWRQRQIEQIDRDYEEYCREHQSKFENDFGNWRSKRQGQRQMVGQAQEHMEVVGSDGTHVGTVDKVRGDRIILTRSDPNAGGIHHSVPCSWVETVAEKVMLNRTAEQAIAEWRDEDRNRALFEQPGQGSEGPHMLNRSFSGTYSERGDGSDRKE